MVPNVALGELLDLSQYGLSVSSVDGGQYPMFKMNNFANGFMSDSGVDTVDLEYEEFSKYKLEYGDILFNRTNSIDLVGKTGVFTLKGNYVFASYLVRLKVNKEIADPFFLNYFMNFDGTKLRLRSLATKAVSQANINPTQLKKLLRVPLFPLPEQRKIAQILSTWDKAITTTEKLIDASKQQKKSLMQQLLMGKKRLIDPETGKAFEGEWEEVKLDDVASKVMVGIASAATHAYTDSGIRMLRNLNIKDGWIDDSDMLYISEEYETQHKNKRLKAGDILTVRTGYPGLSAVVPSKYDQAQCFTSLITRLNQDRAMPEFVCRYINSEYGKKFITSGEAGGAQKNVNAGMLKLMPLPLPSLAEQQKIASVLTAADKEIELLEAKLAYLQQEKKALMQQLLTGKRRVMVAETEVA